MGTGHSINMLHQQIISYIGYNEIRREDNFPYNFLCNIFIYT